MLTDYRNHRSVKLFPYGNLGLKSLFFIYILYNSTKNNGKDLYTIQDIGT